MNLMQVPNEIRNPIILSSLFRSTKQHKFMHVASKQLLSHFCAAIDQDLLATGKLFWLELSCSIHHAGILTAGQSIKSISTITA